MARYIDAELLDKPIDDYFRNCYDSNGHLVRVPQEIDVSAMIHNTPIADVQKVRHGKWINKTIKVQEPPDVGNDWYDEEIVVCSKCDESTTEFYPLFCPHCGAKMDGEE